MRALGPTLVLLAMGVAGCGAPADVHVVRHWPSDPPYIPPRDPSAYARAGAAHAGGSAPGREDRLGTSTPEIQRAPTDAQVARELKEAFGGSGGGRPADLVHTAGLTGQGLATVPPAAPAKVAAIIAAANQVASKPYVYGGGHGRLKDETFIDTAYDCSGSVSFALAAAGLIGAPMDSSALARFGEPGRGKWVTIYANAGHAFMTVAGLRFDTSGRQEGGSRWQTANRGASGFAVRHPRGL